MVRNSTYVWGKRSSLAMTPHSNPEWGVITPHGTLKSWQVCDQGIKGKNISFLPSISLAVKLFTPSKGVYIARLLITRGHTGEARQRTPTFYCQALNKLIEGSPDQF